MYRKMRGEEAASTNQQTVPQQTVPAMVWLAIDHHAGPQRLWRRGRRARPRAAALLLDLVGGIPVDCRQVVDGLKLLRPDGISGVRTGQLPDWVNLVMSPRARNRIELGYRCSTLVAGVIGSFSIPSCQVARTRVAQTFDYEHRFTEHEHRCAEHEHRCAEHDVAREKSCAIQSPVVYWRLVSPIRIGRIGTRRKKPEIG